MNQQPYRVLLYYQYVTIPDPEAFADEHRALCEQLQLRGRIIVAPEGINGTVSGTVEQTDAYQQAMHNHSWFADMAFKVDDHDGHAFHKMHVRVKPELVPMKLDQDVNPRRMTGKRLSPKEFREWMEREDVVILDGRNGYEFDLGHFRHAVRADVDSFREFPDWIQSEFAKHKEKTVLTYCTGGIRCEKLSGFLLREGFKEVYQLDGGIVNYGHDPDVQGDAFEGQCYVFDERIAVPVNRVNPVVVGHCYHCQRPAETYINCAWPKCHRQHLVCDDCREQHQDYCSEECQVSHHREVS